MSTPTPPSTGPEAPPMADRSADVIRINPRRGIIGGTDPDRLGLRGRGIPPIGDGPDAA
jgi:hypothetical protein